MPVSEKNKIQVLSRAKEILSSRLRYNQAMTDDLASYTAAELKDFFYTMNFQSRVHIDSLSSNISELECTLFALRDKFLEAIRSDLKMLGKLLEITDLVMHDKASLLSLLNATHLFHEHEDREMQVSKKIFSDSRLQLIRHEKTKAESEANKRGLAGKAAKEYINSVVKLLEGAERSHKYYASERLEFYFISEIMDLVDSLADPTEKKFVEEYVTFCESNTIYFYALNTKFKSQVERGCKNINSLLTGIAMLSPAYEYLKNQLNLEIKQILKRSKIILLEIERFDLHDNYMDLYQEWVANQAKVREISSQLQAAKDEEARYNLQQQQIRQEKERQAAIEEKARQEIERKVVKEAKARQTKNHQSSKTETVPLEKEKQVKLEKQKQLEKERREQEAEEIKKAETVRKETVRLETIKRKADIEAERVRRAQEKHNSMIKVTSETKIVTQDAGKLVAPYKFKAETIKNNHQSLIHLFSPLTKKMSFDDAVTLIGHLGGKVEANKHGSSHHAITFTDNIYTYLDGQPKIIAGGLPRPHNGETNLYRFELKLLRQSIESLLPEGWVEQNLSTQNDTVKFGSVIGL